MAAERNRGTREIQARTPAAGFRHRQLPPHRTLHAPNVNDVNGERETREHEPRSKR